MKSNLSRGWRKKIGGEKEAEERRREEGVWKQRGGGKEREEERPPPPLQGALTVRKYRAHHVAECTVEGDLDDPWYPRQLGRTEEEGGQDERERNKSPERSRRAEEKGKPSEGSPERRVEERCERRGGMRERTRIKRRKSGRGGGGTLKRRTFPHEPPKMRPGIVEPEPPMPRS